MEKKKEEKKKRRCFSLKDADDKIKIGQNATTGVRMLMLNGAKK